MGSDQRRLLGTHGRFSRRVFVGAAATMGLAACGGSKQNPAAKPSATLPASGQAPSTAAAGGTARTPAGGGAAQAATTPAALDSTKGKPGGTYKYILTGYPAKFTVVDQGGNYLISGHLFSSLLALNWGVQSVPFNDYSLGTDLAQALPEQPDQTTYVFKLRESVKFHNGRTLTAQDVQYSYDRYLNEPSRTQAGWQAWYDHVETPDAQTVVLET